jgi:hypothetical protein
VCRRDLAKYWRRVEVAAIVPLERMGTRSNGDAFATIAATFTARVSGAI